MAVSSSTLLVEFLPTLMMMAVSLLVGWVRGLLGRDATAVRDFDHQMARDPLPLNETTDTPFIQSTPHTPNPNPQVHLRADRSPVFSRAAGPEQGHRPLLPPRAFV